MCFEAYFSCVFFEKMFAKLWNGSIRQFENIKYSFIIMQKY